MGVSQRPSEVDETILSQCGTVFALRLSNPEDRSRVKGTLPDGLVTLMDTLPVLRTGEAIITGEAASMPMRCRITLPEEIHRPRSRDPEVSEQWSLPRRKEGYEAKADELIELRDQLARPSNERPEFSVLRAKALGLVDKGEFESARKVLAQG